MKHCKTPKCHGIPKNGNYCCKCKTKKYRQNNPINACYQILKDNAKRRGKDFSLTLSEFKQFAIDTQYYKKKGIYSKSFHIDRIDESKGYSIDNIQVLTNTQNVKKFLKYYYDERARKMEFSLSIDKGHVSQTDAPF